MTNGTFVKDNDVADRAVDLKIGDRVMTLTLADGRRVEVPLNLYPTLKGASRSARQHWRFIGRGWGIHWVDLDLDLMVRGIVRGDREMFPPPPPMRSTDADIVIAKADRGWLVVDTKRAVRILRTKRQAQVWVSTLARSSRETQIGSLRPVVKSSSARAPMHSKDKKS